MHIPPHAEMRCISNFTFLRGASQPEELLARAKQLGYTALAIAEWITSPAGRPLSLSLPFGAPDVPLTGNVIESYFDNLLPDSDQIRRRVAARFRTGSTDVFDLLQAIGRDCVGAVQFLAEPWS